MFRPFFIEVARQTLARRCDPDPGRFLDRPLRGWVEAAERFNIVSEKFESDGELFSRGPEVENTAAAAELSALGHKAVLRIAIIHEKGEKLIETEDRTLLYIT